MGWLAHNKYFCSGTITSSIVLSDNNSDAGSIPTGWVTYDDNNYSAGSYENTAIYEGEYEFTLSAYRITWEATGNINFQYATSENGVSYSAWSGETSAITKSFQNINDKYSKIRFIFKNSSWSSSDSVYVKTVGEFFTVFSRGKKVDADELNSNFYYCRKENFLPKGGVDLNYTTGVYDLGEDIYRWKDFYVNNIQNATLKAETWKVHEEIILSVTATEIEFTGLKDEIYLLECVLKVYNTNSVDQIQTYLNNDSSASYDHLDYYGRYDAGTGTTEAATVTVSYADTAFNFSQTENTTSVDVTIYSNLYIISNASQGKLFHNDGIYTDKGTSSAALKYNFNYSGYLNNLDTLSSIKISCSHVTNASFLADTKIKLWRKSDE